MRQAITLTLPFKMQPVTNGENGEPKEIDVSDISSLCVRLHGVGETGQGKEIGVSGETRYDIDGSNIVIHIASLDDYGYAKAIVSGKYGQVCLRAEVSLLSDTEGETSFSLPAYVFKVVDNSTAAATIVAESVEDLKRAIAELPDGQAVSVKVAEHTVALSKLHILTVDELDTLGNYCTSLADLSEKYSLINLTYTDESGTVVCASILPSTDSEHGWLYEFQEGWRVCKMNEYEFYPENDFLDLASYMDGHSTRIATKAETGEPSDLTTDDKSSIVAGVNEVNGKVGNLQLVRVVGIGHKSDNLLDPTKYTKQYINASTGAAASASTRRATDFVPITEDGIWLRGFAAYGSAGGMAYYDANKRYISGLKTGNNAGQYFPYVEGAAYARFTINQNDTSGSECFAVPNSKPHVYEPYGSGEVAEVPVLNKDVLTAMPALSLAGNKAMSLHVDTLSDGYQNMTDAPYYVKTNGVVSLSAKLSSLGELRIGFGRSWTNSLHLKVDATKVQILHNSNDTVKATFNHGLTIEEFVNVAFSFDKEEGYIFIGTKGGIKAFKSTNVFIESYGRPYMSADASTTLTDVTLKYTAPKFRCPIWVFGDSYTSVVDTRWTYHMIKTFGVDQFLLDGLAGASSADMYAELKRAMVNGTPRFLVWCLGMNDTFANWKKYYEQVEQTCEAYGIELILQTIPIPSSGAAEKQSINAFIKQSGHRYVDICAAVSPNSSATWYEGYNEDGVHPTVLGAKAIASRFLADVPEFLQ